MLRGLAVTLLAALGLWALLPAVAGVDGRAHAQGTAFDSTNRRSAPAFKTKSADLMPSTKVDTSQPLYLQGDQLVYDNSGNAVIARGNVEIYYNNYILTADEVVYDQSAGTLTAVGNVVLKEPNGNVIRADRYTLTDDFRDGFVQQLSSVAKDDTRIAATRAVRRDGSVTEFTDGKFTPCKSADGVPPLWCISAARIIHDQKAATITYQDAQFEVLGQPFVYLPYFQHADPSVKRRSGFLFPGFGSSDELGFMTTIPYYFALDPSYDFTFKPSYYSEQGVMWAGDWRQKLANGEYTIKFNAIEQDGGNLELDSIADLSERNVRREELDGWRGSVETKGLFELGSWWKAGWDITVESDDTFRRFYKLDSQLLTDRVNEVYMVGQGDRSFFGASLYQFGGLLLDDSARSESLVHPVIDYNYVHGDPVLGGELKWNTNAVSMTRSEKVFQRDANLDFIRDPVTGVRLTDEFERDMSRVVTELSWRRQLIDRIGITYTPYANLRGDAYQMNDYVDAVTGEKADEESFVRGIGTAGATVSYPWIATSRAASHTIEPIGQIVARTATGVDQRHLPNEDAQSLVFDDTNLFEFDKFSGYDRIETGTRANVGVQYTFQLNQGGYARLVAGQSFQLSGTNPYTNPGYSSFDDPATPIRENDRGVIVGDEALRSFNPNNGLDTDRSDYVLGAYIAPIDAFRVIGQSRFDEDDFDVRRADIFSSTTVGPMTFDASYAFTSALPESGLEKDDHELSGGIGFKLTEYWSVRGSIRYDLDDDFLLSDTIQVRYADECFILQVSYTETEYQDDRGLAPDRTVFLRFAFKHLGQFDYRTDALDYVSGDQQPPDR